MKFLWQIEDNDISKVKSFFEVNKNNVFVLNRIERNIKKIIPQFSKNIFWEAMVSCLLTTQQRLIDTPEKIPLCGYFLMFENRLKLRISARG